MKKAELPLLLDRLFTKGFVGKTKLSLLCARTDNQGKFYNELLDKGIIQEIEINGEGISQYVIVSVNQGLFVSYCQAVIDGFCYTDNDLSTEVNTLLNAICDYYGGKRQETLTLTEKVLGTFTANPIFADDSQSNPANNIHFNRTVQSLVVDGFFKLQKYKFDPTALPLPVSFEEEEKLKHNKDSVTKIKYLPAPYSQYLLEPTDNYFEYFNNIFRKEPVCLYFNPDNGYLKRNDTELAYVSLKTNEYKVLKILSEGAALVNLDQVFPQQNNSDFRNELARQIRERTGLTKDQFINKDGVFTLGIVKVIRV